MKNNRRIIAYIIYLLLGAVLLGLGFAEIVDEFWCGMGAGLVAVAVLRLVRMYRISNNETYREKVETEAKDERNHFIRNKAWAWAGYLFILIAGVAVIILKVMGQDLLSMMASYAICLILILYWGAYMILNRKY